MRNLYLDTEFTRLDPECRLISLALVAPAGSEFYVELTDGWCLADCSDFVIETVLPQLQASRHGQTRDRPLLLDARLMARAG